MQINPKKEGGGSMFRKLLKGRDYELKTIITEKEQSLTEIEVLYLTETTSFPLLTLTYSKNTGDFVLTIERRFIAQKSILQALTEAIEKVKEVIAKSA